MTNKKLTKKIAEKVKEIRELYLKEYPQGDYLTITIWEDNIKFHNTYYDEDSDFPINYSEFFKEKE